MAALGTVMVFGLPVLYLVQPTLSRRAAGVVGVVDPAELEADVRLLSTTAPPRDHRHPERLDDIATWIKGRMASAGGRVSEQVYQVQGRTYRNVVARFGPEQGRLVVVGAHYDACGPNPGADDNASGVAGLLGLANLLGQTPPKDPVELVAYTLEEPPFFRTRHMGSVHHAQGLASRKTPVKAMICLEMIGTFSQEEGSQRYPVPGLDLVYPGKGDFIAVIGGIGQGALVRWVKAAMQSTSPLPVWSMNAPSSLTGVDFSDHASYWKEGFPAVMITDTAFYRNPRYHTALDTPDKLDYPRMAQVVQGVFVAVRALGE
ncbi:MAG: M28 family peptidase [Holophagaceae bacterium]|nr:M28 family peptidase [Holophagaceae bacterium]